MAEVDKLVGAVDVLVAEQRSEWEGWDALRFGGRCSGVGGVVAAAASLAAVFSAVSKVFWRSLSMSQVGWGIEREDNVVLGRFAVLLSSRGCASWYLRVSSGAWTLLTGSHVLSLSGYPFHLIRYWSLRR